jgi:hypothetical protein
MRNKVLGFLAIILLTSCAKDTEPSGDLNGTYNGFFVRSGDLQDEGSVRIVFVANIFSGETTAPNLNICNGNYNVFGDSIQFKNLCSGINLLSGNFYMKENGDSLYFSRNVDSILHYQETYVLKK